MDLQINQSNIDLKHLMLLKGYIIKKLIRYVQAYSHWNYRKIIQVEVTESSIVKSYTFGNWCVDVRAQ